MMHSKLWENRLAKAPLWMTSVYAAICSFGVYFCMYAFRKPFTAAGFDDLSFLGMSYKVWLVIAQVIGYMLSKFYGIRFISGLDKSKRAISIVTLILISWVALFFFAVTPVPYGIIFLLINGFPLGLVWGLVFSYLEGRRATEFMGTVLSVSFIFSSGVVKTVGKSIVLNWQISEFWMPFVTGALFLLPMLLFVWLLNHVPPPTEEDIRHRTVRKPMTKEERKSFLVTFLPGIIIIVASYVLLTILRDFRDNFSNELWTELGYGNQPDIFATTETIVSLIVLLCMSALVVIKSNIRAFMINHYIIISGYVVALAATLLFINKNISPVVWMTMVGTGLYLSYVPFNALYYERMIAGFRIRSNVGFLMYISDSFGYLGSVVVLLAKSFLVCSFRGHLSSSILFLSSLYLASVLPWRLPSISKESMLLQGKNQSILCMPRKTAIVVGAGMVGLAIARSLAERDYAVTVFERNEKAVGASIRNFGMLWPVGQPDGKMYERALQSKSIWKHICEKTGLWHNESGSLHLCYNELEWQVVNELAEAMKPARPIAAISREKALQKSEAAKPDGLLGALWSSDEMIIESRVAIEKLPVYLAETYGVQFHFNTAVSYVSYPNVFSGDNRWNADIVYVCGGADFETLYPEVFLQNHFTKCKLQMLRLAAQPDKWSIGPSLCGGLSLIHYKSFEAAASLPLLRSHYHETMPDYIKWGIHVMASQNGESELTIGDSHEYGLVHDPFDKQFINQLIIDYLKQFAQFKNWNLLQSWNGIYPKKTDGKTDFVYQPEEGVTIVNGLGGAGMTLSFGFAEDVVKMI